MNVSGYIAALKIEARGELDVSFEFQSMKNLNSNEFVIPDVVYWVNKVLKS